MKLAARPALSEDAPATAGTHSGWTGSGPGAVGAASPADRLPPAHVPGHHPLRDHGPARHTAALAGHPAGRGVRPRAARRNYAVGTLLAPGRPRGRWQCWQRRTRWQPTSRDYGSRRVPGFSSSSRITAGSLPMAVTGRVSGCGGRRLRRGYALVGTRAGRKQDRRHHFRGGRCGTAVIVEPAQPASGRAGHGSWSAAAVGQHACRTQSLMRVALAHGPFARTRSLLGGTCCRRR
jgi:hypothetical protein